LVLEKLAEGSVSLTAVALLSRYFTARNHVELLNAAHHRSRVQVQALIAERFPKKDAPTVVRKLPAPMGPSVARPQADLEIPALAGGTATTALGEAEPATGGGPQCAPESMASREARPTPVYMEEAPTARAVVEPLSPERYKVQFTADAETHRALGQAQELLRHRIPDGDPAKVLKLALNVLVEKLMQEKFGKTSRPRKRNAVSPLPGLAGMGGSANGDGSGKPKISDKPIARKQSRHIPAEVRREVWRRDEGKCAFVGATGKRCGQRGWLEFHHVHPYALGGPATVENIQLRCRAHNAYEGQLAFRKSGGHRGTHGSGQVRERLAPEQVYLCRTVRGGYGIPARE
jgi:hypothetical protein